MVKLTHLDLNSKLDTGVWVYGFIFNKHIVNAYVFTIFFLKKNVIRMNQKKSLDENKIRKQKENDSLQRAATTVSTFRTQYTEVGFETFSSSDAESVLGFHESGPTSTSLGLYEEKKAQVLHQVRVSEIVEPSTQGGGGGGRRRGG